jgi:hypothetical protein
LKIPRQMGKLQAWRTLANQKVILRIGPLGKLGHFESTAEIFLVYIASISLASGPILSITSWYTKVLRAPGISGNDLFPQFPATYTSANVFGFQHHH